MQYDAHLIGTIEAALNCLRTGGEPATVAERLDVGLRLLVAHDANAVAQRAAHPNSLIFASRVVAPRRPPRVLPAGPNHAVANARPINTSDTPTQPDADTAESAENAGKTAVSIPACPQCGGRMRMRSKQGEVRYLKCEACNTTDKLVDGVLASSRINPRINSEVEQAGESQ